MNINDNNEPKTQNSRTPAGHEPFFWDYPDHSGTVGRYNFCCNFKISGDFCCNLRFFPSDFLLDFWFNTDFRQRCLPSSVLRPKHFIPTRKHMVDYWFPPFLFVDACIMAEMLQLFCSNNIAPEPNICQLELCPDQMICRTKITMKGIFHKFSGSSTTTSAIVEAVPHIVSTMQYSPVKSVSLHLVGSTRSDVANSVSLVFLMLSVSSQDKIHW